MEKAFSDLVSSNMTFESLLNNGTALAEFSRRLGNVDMSSDLMWRQYSFIVNNLLQRDEIQVGL